MHDLRCRIIWHQDPADNSHTSNFKAPGKPRNNQFCKEEKSTGGLVIKSMLGGGGLFRRGALVFLVSFYGGLSKISANVTEGIMG